MDCNSIRPIDTDIIKVSISMIRPYTIDTAQYFEYACTQTNSTRHIDRCEKTCLNFKKNIYIYFDVHKMFIILRNLDCSKVMCRIHLIFGGYVTG